MAQALTLTRMTRILAERAGGSALVLVLLSEAWCGASAQSVVARGTVTDHASGRPVVGAIVRIAAGSVSRVTRTDETGGFRFAGVGIGRLALTVRNLGYEPFSQTIDVAADPPPIAVRLRRLTVLDTIRVRAANQGLFGVVASAATLRPLPGATVRIIGVGGGRVAVDSTGRFFVPINVVGSYFLRALAPGHEPQTLTVLVAPNEGVEVAFLLDSATRRLANRLEVALGDFDERYKTRGLLSAIVSRSELLRNAGTNLFGALRLSPSWGRGTLRFTDTACLFVDGIPRPALSMNAVDPSDVEMVEAYGANARHSDRSRTLANAWPRNAPCGDTGHPRVIPPDAPDIVKWVVIWLKH